jgi:AAA+ superfamily predicted ATPase
LTFLTTATNVLFLGPPGVGKTHLACGLAGGDGCRSQRPVCDLAGAGPAV